MEYCYSPEHGQKCICGGLEEKCKECGKTISDCEWVSNWTSCSDCFSAGFDQYLKDKEQESCTKPSSPELK